MTTQTMMLVASKWGPDDKQTFRAIPISQECPYNEIVYDPEAKILIMVSKIKKQVYQLLPKVDDHGDLEFSKKPRPSGKPYKEERRLVDSYYEYTMHDSYDIENFLKAMCVNYDNHRETSDILAKHDIIDLNPASSEKSEKIIQELV